MEGDAVQALDGTLLDRLSAAVRGAAVADGFDLAEHVRLVAADSARCRLAAERRRAAREVTRDQIRAALEQAHDVC